MVFLPLIVSKLDVLQWWLIADTFELKSNGGLSRIE